MQQNTRPWNSPLVVFVVVFCLVLATGTFVARELNAKSRGGARAGAVREGGVVGGKLAFIPDWKVLASVGHAEGRDTAPVQAVLFADYQCPGCAELHRLLAIAADSMRGRLQIVTRHYPLSGHAHARAAANAAECSAQQNRFAAFQDVVYTKQDSIGRTSWQSFAASAGVPDTASFNRCVAEETFRAIVERDRNAANALNLPGTPVLIVNGQPYFGAPSFAELMVRLNAGGRDAK